MAYDQALYPILVSLVTAVVTGIIGEIVWTRRRKHANQLSSQKRETELTSRISDRLWDRDEETRKQTLGDLSRLREDLARSWGECEVMRERIQELETANGALTLRVQDLEQRLRNEGLPTNGA